MNKSVLLLEDDPNFRDLVRPALQNLGIRIIEAKTGAEAKVLVESDSPDLLIIDGVLPDTDGIQWLSELRNSGNKIPAVYVSSYFGHVDSYKHLTEKLGVLLLVQKPVKRESFALQMRILLEEADNDYKLDEQRKANVQNSVATIALRYAAELPLRLSELSNAIEEAKEDPEEAALLLQARSFAHKLRGSAASYGFQQLGDEMAIIENTLLALVSTEPTPDQWADIDRAMERAKTYA